MHDWVECFTGNYQEQERKSKLEVKKTLTQKEFQTDPQKNFLWKLMSREPWLNGYRDCNGICKRRVDLAMLFLRVMMENSYWRDFIVTSLGPRYLECNLTILDFEEQNLTTSEQITEDSWLGNELHDAAEPENVELVKKLIAAGTVMQVNEHECTPLHSAANAVNPSAEIAKLLVDSVNGSKDWLDKQTDDEYGKNTALHMAAANANVTDAFIQQFKEADSRLRNLNHYTPFHVAAKSSNPNAVIYLLNTFKPTNNTWDVDSVDECHSNVDKVINICARNGNAKAVALLIKHGADISQGVLHEIVLESVRNPEKTNDLVRVYQSVVDNAVTWRSLEEEKEVSKIQ